MQGFRELVKRILPQRMVASIRRRRAVKRFVRAVAHELAERETQLDDLEERLATRRGGFYARIVKEVLERVDLVLQELDRRIEGQEARHAGRIRELETEIAALRERLESLRAGDPAAPVRRAE
ncbi:MAG TPA: hypothetical protein VEA19_04590 [Actinomycetota bacterium]|nr:hypothetical protein [Actinomycetota bacterium]